MDIEHLEFENGPKRVGPFSHAVKAGEFIFITGQMPTLPENPDVLVSNDVEKQTHQVMKNLISVLDNCGSSLERVTFEKVNKIYKSYFNEDKLPARTCIGVTGLAVGASVEIDLVAKV